MPNNKDMMSTENVLDQLAFLAEEELKLRDTPSSKPKKKNRRPQEQSEQEKKPDAAAVPQEENPFDTFVARINEAAAALENRPVPVGGPSEEAAKPAAEDDLPKKQQPAEQEDSQPEKPGKKKRRKSRKNKGKTEPAPVQDEPSPDEPVSEAKEPEAKDPSKEISGDLREKSRRLGEEISKERAEAIIAGKKTNRELGGRRATIIIHRTVVDTEGNQLDPSQAELDALYEEKEASMKAAEPQAPAEVMEEVLPEEEPVFEEPAEEPEQIQEPKPEPAPEEEPPKPEQPSLAQKLFGSRLSLVRIDTGEIYPLDHEMTIGREDYHDISIPEPEGHYVSGDHAHIEIKGKDIYLYDDDSTNGTKVNGSKIKSKRLRAGQTVTFADIEFAVEKG